MFFYNLNSKIYKGRSYVEDDTSLIFRYSKGIDLVLDYTISLGGNPRYLMDLSSKTGRCGPLRCFLAGTKVVQRGLEIPEAKKGALYFQTAEEVVQYSGTMYIEMEDIFYYDQRNNVVCIGNFELKGEVIEFVENTYALICENKLKAVFMRVKGMERNIVIKNEHIYLKKESD